MGNAQLGGGGGGQHRLPLLTDGDQQAEHDFGRRPLVSDQDLDAPGLGQLQVAVHPADDWDEYKHPMVAPAALGALGRRPQLGLTPLGQPWRNQAGLGSGSPAEVFALVFSFLHTEELARAACVCHGWRQVAQDAHLWPTLDLSPRFFKISDRFLAGLLGSPQFASLRTLRLDLCSGLTPVALRSLALQPCAATLEELSLAGCRGLRPALHEVFMDPRFFPRLRRLELYEAVFPSDVEDLVPSLRAVRPELDLGCLELIHAAVTGREDDQEAVCRHGEPEERVGPINAPDLQWCFGEVIGRLVYTNLGTGGLGNLPEEVLFSCTNHSAEDLRDPELINCEKCECLVREESAWNEVCCRVCRDQLLLVDKSNWIPLRDAEGARRIRQLDLSDVADHTLELCDRAHLPRRLQTYGAVQVELDYSLPRPEALEDPGEQEAAARAQQDPRRVPLRLFAQSNRPRIDEALEGLRGRLNQARRDNNNRALLCYTGQGQVEVLADKAMVVDGLRGLWAVEIAQSAWDVSTELLWALLGLLVLVAIFGHYNNWNPNRWDGSSDYLQYMDRQEEQVNMSIIFYVLVGVVVVMILAILAFRYQRERFISLLKFLYQLNIWLVYAGGLLIVCFWAAAEFGIAWDLGTAGVLVFNWGILGVYTLFSRHCPRLLHSGFQVALHATMGLSVAVTLGSTLTSVLAGLLILADVVAWGRGVDGWLGDELVLAVIQDDFIPRILYLVGGLRLRVVFFLAYAVLASASMASLGARIVTLLAIWTTFAVFSFLVPYLGVSKLQHVRAFVVAGFLVFLMRLTHAGVSHQLELPQHWLVTSLPSALL